MFYLGFCWTKAFERSIEMLSSLTEGDLNKLLNVRTLDVFDILCSAVWICICVASC